MTNVRQLKKKFNGMRYVNAYHVTNLLNILMSIFIGNAFNNYTLIRTHYITFIHTQSLY